MKNDVILEHIGNSVWETYELICDTYSDLPVIGVGFTFRNKIVLIF